MKTRTQKHKSPSTRRDSTILGSYFCIFFALLCALLLPSLSVAKPKPTPTPSPTPACTPTPTPDCHAIRTRATGPAPDPGTIIDLAAQAYVWGLGPEFIQRFSIYNTIISQPYNAYVYSPVPAAWNNQATNAGDASVLYTSGFVNFDQDKELVLTVPPTNPTPSINYYYVVAYYDGYGNTIGSIGTRTTPSATTTSYLLVGPKSPYAKKKTAKIKGYEYPVMASDTNINWFLNRTLANTLIDSSDPTWGWSSVPNIVNNVQDVLALNTLQEFEANGHKPVYPASFITPPATAEELCEAAPFQNLPTCALDFFNQLGDAVVTNPVPKANTGLSGAPLSGSPSDLRIPDAPWMVPQAGATTTYFVPSYGQKATFDLFAPIGLKKNGFSIPHNWGAVQLDALQAGYELGQNILTDFIHNFPAENCTNYWGILNNPVGTYPNTEEGYLFRSLIVVEGGVANIALDAIYPTLVNIPLTPGGNAEPLDGDHTYKVTFMPPDLPIPGPCAGPSPYPVTGIYPPMVPSPDGSGNPAGFWSIHVYATDQTESAAPFIAQTSLQNTSYSTVDTSVISVDAGADTMTVNNPNWGTIVSSTPILFGDNAADYGLTPNTVYYVVCSDTGGCPNADGTTSTFQLATQWLQNLSNANPPVPIQGPPPPDKVGPIVDLLSPSGGDPLSYGMVKPVTQLGSAQLAANQLTKNPDGSLTLWFGPGPTPPAGAPASNWIPTPSTAYYQPLYGEKLSTAFQLTLRMYYPTPGDQPPSILPCLTCTPSYPETYVPPAVEMVE